mmetsp:Transcript_2304/g.5212  ORF Transcript_2304/g.5212 Transcript_2304/m.5212 type:complete len:241 (+) Transcript_2304:14-736(+)
MAIILAVSLQFLILVLLFKKNQANLLALHSRSVDVVAEQAMAKHLATHHKCLGGRRNARRLLSRLGNSLDARAKTYVRKLDACTITHRALDIDCHSLAVVRSEARGTLLFSLRLHALSLLVPLPRLLVEPPRSFFRDCTRRPFLLRPLLSFHLRQCAPRLRRFLLRPPFLLFFGLVMRDLCVLLRLQPLKERQTSFIVSISTSRSLRLCGNCLLLLLTLTLRLRRCCRSEILRRRLQERV